MLWKSRQPALAKSPQAQAQAQAQALVLALSHHVCGLVYSRDSGVSIPEPTQDADGSWLATCTPVGSSAFPFLPVVRSAHARDYSMRVVSCLRLGFQFTRHSSPHFKFVLLTSQPKTQMLLNDHYASGRASAIDC